MSHPRSERGASAIVVAASLLLLLGISAVAIDLSAGFNQRTEDQTAADLGVMAAAINGTSEVNAVTAALETTRDNLTTIYSDAEWQALWQGCTDPDRPADFVRVDDPWNATPGNYLECISSGLLDSGGAEIRLRLPDQLTDTTTGGILGLPSLTTHASAHAAFEYNPAGGNVVPFGVLYGTPIGQEACVSQPPGGHGLGVCDGPYSGNFGGIELPFWNTTKNSVVDCSPGADEFETNIALGGDHLIGPAIGGSDLDGDLDIDADDWPGSGGVHPGDTDFNNNSSTIGRLAKRDQCTGDPAVASDPIPAFPVNTVDVDTGFAGTSVKYGLFGDAADHAGGYHFGASPRLQNLAPDAEGDTHSIDVEEKKTGGPGSNPVYTIDNTPLWRYLKDPADMSAVATANSDCDRDEIEDEYDTLGWADARAMFVGSCLPWYVAMYGGSPSTAPEIFDKSIADNSRFAWAPMFQYTDWGSGNGWQPIHSFVPMYFDGIWFNCNGKATGTLDEDCGGKKGLEFYPGELTDGGTYQGKPSGSPIGLRLDQVSALMLPWYALPESVAASFPNGSAGPYTTNLLR